MGFEYLDFMNSIANTRGQGFLTFDEVRYPIKLEKASSEPDSLPTFEGFVLGEAEKAVNTVEMTSNGLKFRAYNDRGLEIERVIFNDPATIVIWKDGTKTVVKCQEGDVYDAEKGLALCISKKALGNKGNFNEVFKKWVPQKPKLLKLEPEITIEGMTEISPKVLKMLEDGTLEKPLYNGRVRCIQTNFRWLTVGKVYEVVNGVLTYDDGRESLSYTFRKPTTFEEFQNKFRSKFEEVKEPSVEEMRRELVGYCHDDDRHCTGCPLEEGYSCCFTVNQGPDIMTDDEIKEAYKEVFKNKEEK